MMAIWPYLPNFTTFLKHSKEMKERKNKRKKERKKERKKKRKKKRLFLCRIGLV